MPPTPKALRAQTAHPPYEPTEVMIAAGIEALKDEGYTPIDRDPLFVWRAMFHAHRQGLPTPQEGE